MDFQPILRPTAATAARSVEVNGPFLVMREDAALPDRCVKCNRPAGGRTMRKRLFWSDADTKPAGGRARWIPVFGKLYAFVSLFDWLRDLRTIRVPGVRVGICRRHAMSSHLLTLFFLAGLPAGLVILWMGLKRADQATLWGGLFLFMAAGIAGTRPRPVKAVHAGVGWVTLAGACPEYLVDVQTAGATIVDASPPTADRAAQSASELRARLQAAREERQ
jgi:hypothetical protein